MNNYFILFLNFSIKNLSNGKQDIVNIDNILDYLK